VDGTASIGLLLPLATKVSYSSCNVVLVKTPRPLPASGSFRSYLVPQRQHGIGMLLLAVGDIAEDVPAPDVVVVKEQVGVPSEFLRLAHEDEAVNLSLAQRSRPRNLLLRRG